MTCRPLAAAVALATLCLAVACASVPAPSGAPVPTALHAAGPVDEELLQLLAQVPARAAVVGAWWPRRSRDLPYDAAGIVPWDEPDVGPALRWVRQILWPVQSATGLAPDLPIVMAAGLTRDHTRWDRATIGALPDLSETPAIGIVLVIPGDPVSLLAELDAAPGTSVEPFSHGVTMRPLACSPSRCAWMENSAAQRPRSPAWEGFLRTPAAIKVHIDLDRWHSMASALQWRAVFEALTDAAPDERRHVYTAGHAAALDVAASMAPSGRYASGVTVTISGTAGLLVRQTATLTPAGATAYRDARRVGRGRTRGCGMHPEGPLLCVSMPFSPKALLSHRSPSMTALALRAGGWTSIVYGLANSVWSLFGDASYPDAAQARVGTPSQPLSGVLRWYDAGARSPSLPTSLLGITLGWEQDPADGWHRAQLGQTDFPVASEAPVDDIRLLYAPYRSPDTAIVVPGGRPLPDVDVLDVRVRSRDRTLAMSLHLRDAAAPAAAPVLLAGGGTAWRRQRPASVCDHAPTTELAAGLHNLASADSNHREAESEVGRWIEAAATCADTEDGRAIQAGWFLFRARSAFWDASPEAGSLARQACDLGRPAGCNLADDIEQAERQGTVAPGPGEMTVVGPGGSAEVQWERGTLGRVLRGHQKRLRACVERGVEGDPDASGPLYTEITIGPSGTVLSASFTGPQAMRACVEAVLLDLRFPASPTGAIVRVTYPLLFDPAQ
jgi:hypothetical protein